jgi:hypothetical protein
MILLRFGNHSVFLVSKWSATLAMVLKDYVEMAFGQFNKLLLIHNAFFFFFLKESY